MKNPIYNILLVSKLTVMYLLHFSFQSNLVEKPFYAVDPTQTARLAIFEHNLVTKLTKIADSNSLQVNMCGVALLNYINEYTKDWISVVNSKEKENQEFSHTFSENPVLAYKMIRRIYTTLGKNILRSACTDNKHIAEAIKGTFRETNLTPPTHQDIQDALMGILRIQFIYGLNASQIQKGIFNEVQTNASLNFADCLVLSKKSISLKVEVMAYHWLQAAYELGKDTEMDLEEIEKTWQKFKSSAEDISKKDFLNKRQLSFPNLYSYEHYATCRGEKKSLNFKQGKLSNLKCLYAGYQWNAYFSIGPVKVEVLAEEPSLILQFYDFLGEKVIQFVERGTKNKLTRSVEENMETGTNYVNHQSSMVTWIDDEEHDILRNLRGRIEKLTALKKSKNKNAGMKVVQYGALGGFYDFHHDAIIDASSKHAKKGNRESTSTFMMFLTDVKMGGFTAFPDLGIFVKPTKGSALLWHSVLPNGSPDPWVQHGGCPVILGRKKVLLVDG